ncbi:heat shock 70 kDa protein 12A-like [Mercenaria mercenaria]|uniref:heat shock 70 kDa protein 12A-like n=1 Tax=Mercenaria mercenaria TaxID=6596 RepID=UPI00234F49A8|nr:heat shock 70 kDa protein 12A-like [Mercenaria mercenaria]
MGSLAVVAIDFGTTYSGWAFSFRHEYEKDPPKISSMPWLGEALLSEKGPTCILIKPDGKTTDSFGYDAESKYAEKVEINEQEQWFFYKRFKMMLFKDQGIERSATLEDESGKKLPAVTVFSLSIDYLKNDVLKYLGMKIGESRLNVEDIQWVLTVPAIWNDAAKQFMREAAQMAGIPGKNLIICLEPEAASIYCRHLPVSSYSEGEKTSLAQLSSGTKYLVLDAGGGTVDITVHEVTTSGDLKELYKASGGAWGGTKVDNAYETFLSSITDEDVILQFKKKHMDDYIEMFQDFELKKRKISLTKQGIISFRMPCSLSILYFEMRGKTLKEQTLYSDKVKVFTDKLRVDADIVKEFFMPTIRNIIDHVATLLERPSVHGCAAILMVGGFSASPILQESVQTNFPNLRIIVPNEAGLAVLKGAVIFGYESKVITERVCKYTYGTDSTHKYSDRCKHPEGRVEIDVHGDLRCYDIFSIHVEAGQSIKLNEEQQERIYSPVSDGQIAINFDIYSSSTTHPHFITDKGCRVIGDFSIPISDTSLGRNHKFGTSFIFGGTEIVVKVFDKATGDVTYRSVNFLG